MPAPPDAPGSHLETRIRGVGQELAASLLAVLEELPGGPEAGPAPLAEALGVDKVLTHRVLKAVRGSDPLATAFHAPGPDPMRRFLRRAKSRGVERARVSRAEAAVRQFESLVRDELGNRSALASVLASFLPEARREFEVRRKQSAFRAMSELFGSEAEVALSSVFLHPAADPESIDIVWLMGSLGLRRLRPGVTVKFATKRHGLDEVDPSLPDSLFGEPGSPATDYRLERFCGAAPAPLVIQRTGDALHYVLGESGFGPGSLVDLVLAEVNRAEIPRTVPVGSGRRGWFYASTTIPSKLMLFDVLVHRDIYPESDPELLLYSSLENGIADVNDITRDIDRLDLIETVEDLGTGLERIGAKSSPRQGELTRYIMEKLGWNPDEFRVWRACVEYPVLGVQVAMAFDPPEAGLDPEANDESGDRRVRRVWQ